MVLAAMASEQESQAGLETWHKPHGDGDPRCCQRGSAHDKVVIHGVEQRVGVSMSVKAV